MNVAERPRYANTIKALASRFLTGWSAQFALGRRVGGRAELNASEARSSPLLRRGKGEDGARRDRALRRK